MLHDHATIWKETGLLITLEISIKHSKEILNLLDAVLLPQDIAIIHWWRHLMEDDPIVLCNHITDAALEAVAHRRNISPFVGKLSSTYSFQDRGGPRMRLQPGSLIGQHQSYGYFSPYTGKNILKPSTKCHLGRENTVQLKGCWHREEYQML